MDRRIVVTAALFAAAVAGMAMVAPRPAHAGHPQAKIFVPPQHDCLPKLGIYGRAVPNHGMLVTGVVRGSEAWRIGLERGDVILSINNHRIRCQHDYFDAMRHSNGVLYLRVLDARGRGVVSTRAYVPCHGDTVHIFSGNAGR